MIEALNGNEHEEEFEGLSLHNEMGSIEIPHGTKIAELGPEVIDVRLGDDGVSRVYINKPALQGVILETNGSDVFSAENRFMLLARVGNIHLPFYVSSEGTSGKREGEWYPFFGDTDFWLIKGGLDKKTGDMRYHAEIDRVKDVLNTNLVISALEKKTGQLQYRDETGARRNFALGEHVHFDSSYVQFMRQKKERGAEAANKAKDEVAYVQKMTGYAPDRTITAEDSRGKIWMDAIVAQIR